MESEWPRKRLIQDEEGREFEAAGGKVAIQFNMYYKKDGGEQVQELRKNEDAKIGAEIELEKL